MLDRSHIVYADVESSKRGIVPTSSSYSCAFCARDLADETAYYQVRLTEDETACHFMCFGCNLNLDEAGYLTIRDRSNEARIYGRFIARTWYNNARITV